MLQSNIWWLLSILFLVVSRRKAKGAPCSRYRRMGYCVSTSTRQPRSAEACHCAEHKAGRLHGVAGEGPCIVFARSHWAHWLSY